MSSARWPWAWSNTGPARATLDRYRPDLFQSGPNLAGSFKLCARVWATWRGFSRSWSDVGQVRDGAMPLPSEYPAPGWPDSGRNRRTRHMLQQMHVMVPRGRMAAQHSRSDRDGPQSCARCLSKPRPTCAMKARSLTVTCCCARSGDLGLCEGQRLAIPPRAAGSCASAHGILCCVFDQGGNGVGQRWAKPRFAHRTSALRLASGRERWRVGQPPEGASFCRLESEISCLRGNLPEEQLL